MAPSAWLTAAARRRRGEIVVAQGVQHVVDHEILRVLVFASGRRVVPALPTMGLKDLTCAWETPKAADAVCRVFRAVNRSPHDRLAALVPKAKLVCVHGKLKVLSEQLSQACPGDHLLTGRFAHEY